MNEPIVTYRESRDFIYCSVIQPDLETYSIYVDHENIIYTNMWKKRKIDILDFPLEYRFGSEVSDKIKRFLNV